MTFDPSVKAGVFAKRKALSGSELRDLRAQVWSDGSVSVPEAERLFGLNASVEPSNEWTEFFVEAICEFMLSQGEPRGYVTEDEATWLLRQVNPTAKVATHAEIELIVKLLERAEYAPSSLRKFALRAIEQSVLNGERAAPDGEPCAARIDDVEVTLIRRLIFAPSSDGPARVSAAEAAMLYRIKDATLGEENSTEWKKLFVQGVANHLMATKGYEAPNLDEEMRLEAPYEPRPFAHILSRVGRPDELHDPLFGEDQEQAIARLTELEVDRDVPAGERNWLERLYNQNLQHDEYEQALLTFLAEEGARPF